MEVDFKLTELTLLVLFALMGGICFSKIKQPPIVGYILCGLILGPSVLGWIQTREYVIFLSDLGIIFLMFVLGFEMHLEYFKGIWKLAIGCTAAQVTFGLIIIGLLSLTFTKWPIELVLLYGFILALSSTSAVVKILDTLGKLQTDNGQRAIAILIAQDLAIVPMIIILQNFTKGQMDIFVILKVITSIGLITGLIVFLSSKSEISLPFSKLVFKDKELVTLTSFAFCVATAWISGILGLSEAFGAFLAGLFLGNTEQQKILLDTIRPIQTLLLMIFFFSTGLLLDIGHIWQNLGLFLFLIFVVTIGKSIVNITILHFFKLSWSDAFVVGILLAQLGEFSFLLTKIGRDLKILTSHEEKLILSLTVISLAFSPIWMRVTKRMQNLTNVNIISLRTTIKYFIKRLLDERTKKVFSWISYYVWHNRRKDDILKITLKKLEKDDD